MQTTGNLFTRNDTLLGVCEAIGQDLGFHPNWLRATLAVLLLASPKIVLAAYAAMAVVVLASRLLFPSRKPAGAAVEAPAHPVAAVNDALAEPLAAAA